MTENKKVVKNVSNAVSKSIELLSLLGAKSKKAVKSIKKDWKEAESKSEMLKDNSKKLLKTLGHGGRDLIEKTIQLQNDVQNGILLGLNDKYKVKENKKVVESVKVVVSKGVEHLSTLGQKSMEAVDIVKKEWKDRESKKEILGKGTKKLLKQIEKGSKELLEQSAQLTKDVGKGIKLGLKKKNK